MMELFVDTLVGIENVVGTEFADSVTGSAADENFFGPSSP